MTPQPDAFITIASTAPASVSPATQRPPGVDVAAHVVQAAVVVAAVAAHRAAAAGAVGRRWSARRRASSTRAVAALMLGVIAGCTQPISISTLRACVRCGHRPARAAPRRRLGAAPWPCSAFGSSGRTAWPSFSAGREQRRRQAFRSSQRMRALAGRARHLARRRCGGRCRPGGRTRRPTGRSSRSCGRSGSGRGAAASRASAPAPSSTCFIR